MSLLGGAIAALAGLADFASRLSQYWVSQGYIVVRIDERGNGSSPGYLNTMSASTSSDFAECVEWAAEQSWCTGKVGLLGISYYGGTQWRVAARKPKGLTCILPWEGERRAFSAAPLGQFELLADPLHYTGMTDYYRDRCRQGGILGNNFVQFVRSPRRSAMALQLTCFSFVLPSPSPSSLHSGGRTKSSRCSTARSRRPSVGGVSLSTIFAF